MRDDEKRPDNEGQDPVYFDPFGGKPAEPKNDVSEPPIPTTADEIPNEENKYDPPKDAGKRSYFEETYGGGNVGGNYYEQRYGAGQNPSGYGYGYGYQPPMQKKNNYATGSLVCGILSIVCCAGYVGLALSVVAVVLAVLSRDKVTHRMEGSALAGMICGIVGLVLGVATIVIVAVMGDELLQMLEEAAETTPEDSWGNGMALLRSLF